MNVEFDSTNSINEGRERVHSFELAEVNMRMINLHAPYFGHFIGPRIDKNSPRSQLLYLSFEDALWDLVAEYQIQKGAIFLLPSFFCTSVSINIEKRGFRCVYYPLDANLQVNSIKFQELHEKTSPAIVVFYHIFGSRPDVRNLLNYIALVTPDSIIIEDCVESLLVQHELEFVHSRHFFIDSLRKISAIHASRVFSYPTAPLKIPTRVSHYLNLYRFKLSFLFLLWQTVKYMSERLDSRVIHDLSNRLFRIHDSCVGQGKYPARASLCNQVLVQLLQPTKIRRIKLELGREFRRQVATRLSGISGINEVPYGEDDLSRLRYFPLRIDKPFCEVAIHQLAEQGIFVEVGFSKSLHSRSCCYLLLPMRPDLRKSDIDRIFSVLEKLDCEKLQSTA